MPVLTFPGVDTLANWQALLSDGVTPSPVLVLAQDITSATPSGDSRSLRIGLAAGTAGHIARCTLPAQDLTPFDELRFVLRSDRAGGNPLTLELRLGSAALPVGAPGNGWHRRLPFTGSNTWDVVRLSLDDLPAAVRGTLTVLQLHCLDDARPFSVLLNQVLAVRPRMLADTEAALLARLNLQFTLNGGPVPALLAAAGDILPAARPCIAVLPLALRQASERNSGQPQRCDFIDGGYRLRPPPTSYELAYGLEVLAGNRSDQAVVTDWLLARLPAQGTLRVAGQALSFEQQPPAPLPQELQLVQVPRLWLRYRAWAAMETAAATPVRPTDEVVTAIDWKERVHE